MLHCGLGAATVCVCVCMCARDVLETCDPKKVLIHGVDHAMHQRLLIKERGFGDGPEVNVRNAPIGKGEEIARMWAPVPGVDQTLIPSAPATPRPLR